MVWQTAACPGEGGDWGVGHEAGGHAVTKLTESVARSKRPLDCCLLLLLQSFRLSVAVLLSAKNRFDFLASTKNKQSAEYPDIQSLAFIPTPHRPRRHSPAMHDWTAAGGVVRTAEYITVLAMTMGGAAAEENKKMIRRARTRCAWTRERTNSWASRPPTRACQHIHCRHTTTALSPPCPRSPDGGRVFLAAWPPAASFP